MKPDLERHGVSLVALSKDTVSDAVRHRKRDGLTFTLLADPELEVIRQFGVEHHKAVEFSKGGLFDRSGIPLALVPELKTMAIPTTLLIDEEGVIQWIDQTDDYRLRSANERVLEAVRSTFA